MFIMKKILKRIGRAYLRNYVLMYKPIIDAGAFPFI